LEHLTPDDQSLREMFDQQKRLATSHDPAERFRTLWVGAMLNELLEQSLDGQIGNLLCAVQDVLGLFSPEFAVCEHAKRRLQRRNLWRR
jgi:hypothetical protein